MRKPGESRCRSGTRRPQDALARDDRAVSDVLGSIVMIGVTVAAMTGLGVVIATFPSPTPTVVADLEAGVTPGAGGWGTGDERVEVRHSGGEPLDRESTAVRVEVDDEMTRVEGDGLAAGFADGRLSIGETWEHTTTIAQTSLISLIVTTGADGGTQTVLSTTLSAPGDSSATTAANPAAAGTLPAIPLSAPFRTRRPVQTRNPATPAHAYPTIASRRGPTGDATGRQTK